MSNSVFFPHAFFLGVRVKMSGNNNTNNTNNTNNNINSNNNNN